MRRDRNFLAYVVELTVRMQKNAMDLEPSEKQEDELEGLLRICLMVKNSKGWPVSEGGVGNMTRQASIDYYRSVFGKVTDTPPKVEFKPMSEMSDWVLSILKKLAAAECGEERAVVSMDLERRMRTTPSFLQYVERLSSSAEEKLFADPTKRPDGVMGELLLGLAVKNAKGWPAAINAKEASARLSEMETYKIVFGTITTDLDFRLIGGVTYGSVCVRGAASLGVPSKSTTPSPPPPDYSPDAAMTKEQFDTKWQRARAFSKARWKRACEERDVERDAKVASEERFVRAVERRARRRAQGTVASTSRSWRGWEPVAFEEDMSEEDMMPFLEEGSPVYKQAALHIDDHANMQPNWEFVCGTLGEQRYSQWGTGMVPQ